MDNEKILYSFCKLLIVFKFTNRVMLTVLVVDFIMVGLVGLVEKGKTLILLQNHG